MDLIVPYKTPASLLMRFVVEVLNRVSVFWLSIVLSKRFDYWGSVMTLLWAWRGFAMTGPVTPIGYGSTPL